MFIFGVISDDIQIYHDIWDIEKKKLQILKISINQYKIQKEFIENH